LLPEIFSQTGDDIMVQPALFQYCLHLADNALILSQRNSEWCGHGPVLEQDIAITNISLDLMGQARNFYQYAASLYNEFIKEEKQNADALIPRPWKAFDRELAEDDLAFLRDEHQYCNLLLVELPKGDWAQTILRQFFFSAFQSLFYKQLQQSQDVQLAAIAEKSAKEVAYHLRWSSEWVIRLGDGTTESSLRMNRALDELWPFTGEMFMPAGYELQTVKNAMGVDVASLKEAWLHNVSVIFKSANLTLPPATEESGRSWMQSGGKEGRHTEYLGYILTEMQYLQRVYPNSVW
jgi:ring-1,2-phenylacetyl-CoA epoxidase subunit PaaC